MTIDIKLIEKLLEDSRVRLSNFKEKVGLDLLIVRIKEIDELTVNKPDFWSLPDSKTILKEQSGKQQVVNKLNKIEESVDMLDLTLSLLKEEVPNIYSIEDDNALKGHAVELLGEINAISKELAESLDDFELQLTLGGEVDGNNAIVTIHSGAGGTESDDWCLMLYRMYSRWANIHNFPVELIDFLEGDEAGYKSVTFTISGEYAYGLLKHENGVHRLVRISPFDASNRRHTSFASVFVMPEIDDDINIDISPSDLRIDTFRASGAGGQHVNTTDSAVRITHVPSGVIVACQNERSQHQNKASAMKLLKSKLYQLELDKRRETSNQLESSKTDIGWGNQIRSYVLHPYKLAKDVRTKVETSSVEAVLDGDIDQFIKAELIFFAG